MFCQVLVPFVELFVESFVEVVAGLVCYFSLRIVELISKLLYSGLRLGNGFG